MADTTSSAEKGVLVQSTSLSPSPTQPHTFDPTAERRLLRKLDLRILPILWLLYLVNFIDRANIGNAKIQGMESALALKKQRFNIAVWVFNLGYLVAGIPLQILFKHYGPKSLCVMMFCWGITVIGCGLVKTWEQLVVCRLLEGIAESAFIAGSAYLIGAYYRKREFLDSMACLPFIPAFPEHCTFLSPEEKTLMLQRIQADGGHVSSDEISLSKALHYLKDWKIWTGVIMNLAVTEAANSLSNFQPTILKGLGYTATSAQIHTIPVYLVGAAFSVVLSHMSTRLDARFPFYLLGACVLATGLVVEITTPLHLHYSAKIRYMGMFFIASGAYLAMPISIIWTSINCTNGYKRAVAITAIINFGTAGAFVSSNVFLFKEAPRFRTGFSVGLGLACGGMVAAGVTWWACRRENTRRDKMMATVGEIEGGEVQGFNEGDQANGFRFAL
ncbi:MFS general substrate transporter [Pyrenophora tritici-repentis]|nr:MFS general substrate transporter [Pyrenophora tritici-repentis]KAI1671329.1 MFS general substrate transporter [Pyrenophora tritici-repentis]